MPSRPAAADSSPLPSGMFAAGGGISAFTATSAGGPSPHSDRPHGWRAFMSDDRRALAVSLLAHAGILAALLVSIDVSFDKKPETRTENSFSVSLDKGEGVDTPIPKASSPKVEQKVEEKTVSQPVEPAVEQPVEQPRQASEQSAPSSSQTSDNQSQATPGGGAMIWTPPPPDPFASGIGAGGARVEKRVEMPKVELAKGASDPILLSYDQGRYSDAAAMSEASRLLNTGTITMSVTVNDKGEVDNCVTTSTSGSRMLDERACALIRSYRYRPAQDARGVPHGALVSEVLEWARDGKFVEGTARPQSGDPAIRRGDPSAPASQQNVKMPVVTLPGK
jgi:TonB family protein